MTNITTCPYMLEKPWLPFFGKTWPLWQPCTYMLTTLKIISENTLPIWQLCPYTLKQQDYWDNHSITAYLLKTIGYISWKQSDKYYINITFPARVIVENIIPRNVIINRGAAEVDNHISRDDIFNSHPSRKCNIYFIIPNRPLDPLLSLTQYTYMYHG